MLSKSKGPTKEQVLKALRNVVEPELQRDLVSLGMIKNLRLEGGKVSFTIELTTPACPLIPQIKRSAEQEVRKVPGVEAVHIETTANVPQGRRSGEKAQLDGVRNIVAVSSGKGGVGKSTVAVNLAVALARMGARAGLCDADIYGPNVPLMMGISQRPRAAAGGKILPLESYGVKVMSMGFLTESDTPIIWRGPMVHQAIQTFLRQVEWGELDYLIIDLPPGTGDAQLTLIQTVPLAGSIVVTTPQEVALADVRKAILMFRQVDVTVLGIIENMSYFACPHCGERTYIFSRGGGKRIGEKFGIAFLGEVPLDTSVREGGDSGRPVVVESPDSPAALAFVEIARQTAARISVAALKAQDRDSK